MVYQNFKLNEDAGALYDIQVLLAVKCRRDTHVESFLNNWEPVLAGMREPLDERILEPLLLEQLKNVQALKLEIEVYYRARKGERERTYAFLMDAARRFLERRRHEENRKAHQALLGGGNNKHAAPAKGKGKGSGGGGGGKAGSSKPDADHCFNWDKTGE